MRHVISFVVLVLLSGCATTPERAIDRISKNLEKSYSSWNAYRATNGYANPTLVMIPDHYKHASSIIRNVRYRVTLYKLRNITAEQMEFSLNIANNAVREFDNAVSFSKLRP